MEKRTAYICAGKALKPFENKFQPFEWDKIKDSIALAIAKGYRRGRNDERKRIHASRDRT